ncbi:uncharacterized protein LOC113029302 isoform X2 [Astatotilapia calliptera]|uniref:uncharacterized protein LOC113029302 isoform X2 n=1 Tax=Astatotilapia calliptera TaxID=8154 RepID=UPI000E40A9D0|nr:uncharacterized protein LOC113029302 isoform X2 [Astatotilapia calliptera]
MSEQDLRGAAAAEAAGVADDEHQREMERTKRKRGTIRGATTRLVHQIDSEMAKPDPDTDHLSALLEMLSAKELSLYALDSEIERKTALDDLEMEIESTEEYKERIILSKSRARRIIKRNEDCRERAAHQRSWQHLLEGCGAMKTCYLGCQWVSQHPRCSVSSGILQLSTPGPYVVLLWMFLQSPCLQIPLGRFSLSSLAALLPCNLLRYTRTSSSQMYCHKGLWV